MPLIHPQREAKKKKFIDFLEKPCDSTKTYWKCLEKFVLLPRSPVPPGAKHKGNGVLPEVNPHQPFPTAGFSSVSPGRALRALSWGCFRIINPACLDFAAALWPWGAKISRRDAATQTAPQLHRLPCVTYFQAKLDIIKEIYFFKMRNLRM